jgi:hypothetical protein
MGMLPILNNAKGPLPLTAAFNAPSDGPSYLTLSGSAWSQSANQMLGVILSIDGTQVGEAFIFSNGVSEHRALVPIAIPVKLTIGPHKLALTAANTVTTTDYNDVFNISLFT